ncbi:MAG TPA: glycosyltransferase family 2 protein, partial [Polyangia bacterium]
MTSWFNSHVVPRAVALRRRVYELNRILYLRADVDLLRDELDALRSKLELDERAIEEYQQARSGGDYQRVFEERTPLVTACVGTYNRAELLMTRSLRALRAQDYTNLEILVVGDGCTDDTEARVTALADPRVRFVNLPARGAYPELPRLRWMVAGTVPFNHALGLARGHFITHLDDDDECPPDRVSTLVKFAQQERADLVWHPFEWEDGYGRWCLHPAPEFGRGNVTTSSIFYHHWFTRIPWDMNAYRLHEP